jgi:hypothetical protein
MPLVDHRVETCGNYGVYRILKNGRQSGILPLGVPVLKLGLSDEIAGIGKGRDPAPIYQHRVPTDMIGMKMRAENHIDLRTIDAGRSEILQKTSLQIVPGWKYAALAVISDASVDNNQRITRPNDKRLYSEEDLTFVIREVRLKPRDSVDRRRRCFGEKDLDWELGLAFDHSRNRNVAHFPSLHIGPSCF